MATFTRTLELYFDVELIADAIEDYNAQEEYYYEHEVNFVPIMDFVYDCVVDENYADFELTKEEESIIIKEVTEELRERGWK
mgnify:CR=1 FL=1